MSGDVTPPRLEADRIVSSAELATAIKETDFSSCAATVVGYGYMGRHYVKALQALGLRQIRVCSRSAGPLGELQGTEGVNTIAGGYRELSTSLRTDELAIVATPTAELVAVAEYLAAKGFLKILIEKPISFWAKPIRQLSEALERQGVDGACAYNRVAYPSLVEARARTTREGGITSATYTFTEFVNRIGPEKFGEDELARWGIANSLHVMSMAHGLIGPPRAWSSFRCGSLAWHPTGSVFVASGVSTEGVPFSAHADWGSTGRWSVEVHTSLNSYRLCPLESLFCRTTALGDWEEVPLCAFAPGIKAGIVEEVAAMLSDRIRRMLPLVSISSAAELASYGEDLFGYNGE